MSKVTGKTYYDSSLIKGNTENGKDWLRKYLHPPGDRGMSYNGYPDKSVVPAIHAEYRLTAETNAEKLGVNFGSWPKNTLLMLRCPGLLFPAFYASNLAQEDPVFKPIYSNTQLSKESVLANFGKQRIAYNSVTAQYDTTDFANAGMIYHAQFSPTTYSLTFSRLNQMLKDKTIHSRTLHQLLPKLMSKLQTKSTDGFVDVGAEPRMINLDSFNFQVVKLGNTISEPTDITMLSPKSYVARATEGLFSVSQCNEDTNRWKSVAPFAFTAGATPNNTYELIACLYEIRSMVDNRIYLEAFTNASGDTITDVEWSDWTWSYTAFVGLTPSGANIAAGNINFKEIQGYEIAPISRSILNSQVSNPALYDAMALDSATVITQSRQDGMPAEYNLAGMGAVVSSIAPEIAKSVGEALGSNKSEKKEVAEEIKASAPVKAEIAEAERTNSGEKPKPQRNVNRKRKPQRSNMSNIEKMLMQLTQQMHAMQMRKPLRRGRSRSSSRRRTPSRGRSKSANLELVRPTVYVNSKYKK